MILEVPIVYKAEVVCGRKRNADEVTLSATLPFEVRETTASEAPVAMWWTESRDWPEAAVRHHDGDLYVPMYGPVRRYGHKDDAFAAPAGAGVARRWGAHMDAEDEELGGSLEPGPGGEPPDLPETIPQLVDARAFALALSAGSAAISGRTASPRAGKRPTHSLDDQGVLRSLNGAPNPQQVKRIKSQELDAKRADMGVALDHLLSVDGVLFRRVDMPVYVVRLGVRVNPEMQATFSDRTPVLGEHAFPVDDYEAARALWRERSRNPNDPDHDPEAGYAYGFLPPPDVVRPDLLPSCDATAFHVGRDVDAALARLAKCPVGQWQKYEGSPLVAGYGREVALAFAHLRDARDSGADPVELAGLLSDLGRAAYSHGTLSDLTQHAETAAGRVDLARSDDLAMAAL